MLCNYPNSVYSPDSDLLSITLAASAKYHLPLWYTKMHYIKITLKWIWQIWYSVKIQVMTWANFHQWLVNRSVPAVWFTALMLLLIANSIHLKGQYDEVENHTDFMLTFLNENHHKCKKLIDFRPFILIHVQNYQDALLSLKWCKFFEDRYTEIVQTYRSHVSRGKLVVKMVL